MKANAVNNTPKDIRFVFSGIQVTYINGALAYISDGNEGALIYKSNIGNVLSVGQIINGTLNTKLQGYFGDAELTEFDATNLTITDGTVPVQTKSLATDNLTTANISMVVDLGLLTYDATNVAFKDDNNNSIKYNNKFNVSNLPTLENGAQYNVKGLLISYSNALNIAPRSEDDITVPATTKSAAETKWVANSKTVRMGDETTGWWSTESDGAKSFSSTNEDVATINATTGAITLVAPGTTTLKFSTAESDDYFAGPEVSMVLTVKAALPTGGLEFTWVAGEKGYTNAQEVTTATENDDPVTIVFAQGEGSNAPKYYTSGSAVRSYAQNTLAVSSNTDDYLLYEVEIKFESASDNKLEGNGLSVSGTTGTWSGVAEALAFSVTNASGNQARIVSINAVYAPGTVTELAIADINLKTTDDEKALNITKNVDATIVYSGINTNVATISDNKVTPVGVGSTTVTARIEKGSNYTAAETTFTISVAEKQIPAMSFPQNEYNANLGTPFTAPTLTKPDGVSVKYSSNNAAVSVDENTGAITLNAEGTAVITATSVVNEDYAEGTASYTLNVTDPNKDYFTATAIGVQSTQYDDWTLATFGSGVTYKGNSAKNGDNIQIRASSNTQDKSGIVATTTKGYVRSVEVATITAERDLDVYGSNDAYSGPADLYGDAKGTLIGTLNTTTKSLNITDNYKYIGLRSRSGAIQLSDITIHWEAVTFQQYTVTYEAGVATGDPVEVADIEEGTTIQLQDNPYTYAGHVFVGWSDGNDVYEAGDDYTVNGDVTLTAQWAQQFNVTYNPGDAGGDPIVRTVAAGAYNLEAGNIFTYAGHAFDGWLKDETKYNANDSYPISENVAFTAQWVEAVDPVTVTFDATIDISDQTTSITKNGITITSSKFDNNEEGKYYYQCYASSAMTVSSEVGNITNIELTCTAEETAKYGPGNWEFAGYSYNSYNGSWAGSAETVEFGTAGQQVRMTQIAVTYIPNGNTPKQPAGLSYTQTSYSIAQNEGFTAPTLNNPNNLVVTYSGNNDAVATVNEETGAITLGEATGIVTITASAAAQGNYNAGTASYTLTVNAPVVIDELTGTWELVTDASQLVAGKKVIIASVPDEGAAVTMSTTQAANNRIGLAGATVSEGVISAQNGTAVFTIEEGEVENTIAFKSSSDEYLYAASSEKNYIRSQETNDDNGSWIVSISEGVATIVAQGENTHKLMRYNPNSGNPIFSCYATNSTTGTLVALYMLEEDTPEPPVVNYTEVRNELTEGWYYTMCLDKAVTAVKAGSIWKVLSKAANGNDVILEEAELPLAAGRPYIFRATETALQVVYTGAAVGAPVNDETNNGLVGSFSQVKLDKDIHTNYIIYNNALYFVNSDNVYVGANRAYLNMGGVPNYEPQQGNAPRRRVVMTVHGEQNATGCENLNASETPVKMIIDGQMYILRGEKLYDATGKLVK